MPPSPRDWLPEDHLAWFVLDVVEQMDLSPFYARRRADGWGAAAFDPEMMVALLLYASCVGERPSRRIERRCTPTTRPSPGSAGGTRRRSGTAPRGSSSCAGPPASVGLVALDGTEVEANAWVAANHTVEAIGAEVERILAEAAQADAGGDRLPGTARGDELPPGFRDRGGRLARLARAKARLEEEEAEPQRAYQEHLARRAALEAERGRRPVPKRPRSPGATRANTTDPDGRVVKRGPTLIQGPGAQAVVTEDRIIVAACVAQDAGDRRQLRPMLARAKENLAAAGGGRRMGTLLADAGYRSDREIESLLADPTAPKLLVAPEDHPAHRTRKSPSASLRARMRRRLTSSRGQALYARRPQICEPVFGEIKWVRGASRFMRRGLAACDAEWKLLCATNNLRKLWRATVRGPARPT